MTDPLPPLLYEFLNSLVSSLAVPVVLILLRFFYVEFLNNDMRLLRTRMRVRLGLGICALVAGEGIWRGWTWYGRLCENTKTDCTWMTWPSFAYSPSLWASLEAIGMLCLIKVLSPDVWGRRAWIIAGVCSGLWSLWWFSPLAPYRQMLWYGLTGPFGAG